MSEFMPQDLVFACQAAGLLHPHGETTPLLEELVELAGPVLAVHDEEDPALVTEVRLAAGPLVENLGDEEIAQLLPFLRREYDRRKFPSGESA
jgi:hypothetical protein